MNKKKFVNKETGEIKIGKVYQSKKALWYTIGCYTYSQLHRIMKHQGFVPLNS